MRAGTEGCDRAGLAGLGEHCRALSWRILQVGQISWAEELSPEVRRHYPCSSLLTQATDTQPPLILIPVLIPLPALAHVFSLFLCPPHCSFLSAPSQGSQAAGRAHPLSPLEAREWIPSLPEEQRGLKLGPISPAREPEVSGMGSRGTECTWKDTSPLPVPVTFYLLSLFQVSFHYVVSKSPRRSPRCTSLPKQQQGGP